ARCTFPGGCRSLQVVETFNLLLGGIRHQIVCEHPANGGVVRAPLHPHQCRECLASFALCRGALTGSECKTATEYQVRDTLGILHRVSDRDGAALRQSEQWEPLDACRIDDCCKVVDPRIQRYLIHVPIRQACAARIVTDQPMIARKPDKKMPPDRTLPIVFQMVQPVSGLDQRRTFSANGVSQAHAVCCPAIANFLALIGNCQSIALDGKGLDRVRYVLE